MKKRVFFDKNSFASMIQARAEIGEFIEGIYNRNHRHSTLGYQEAYSVAGEIGFSWWLVEHYSAYHVNCPDGCGVGEPARGR